MHVPWAILHDRDWVEFSDSLRLRASYPVLPWIGVIAIGYYIGPAAPLHIENAVPGQRGVVSTEQGHPLRIRWHLGGMADGSGAGLGPVSVGALVRCIEGSPSLYRLAQIFLSRMQSPPERHD